MGVFSGARLLLFLLCELYSCMCLSGLRFITYQWKKGCGSCLECLLTECLLIRAVISGFDCRSRDSKFISRPGLVASMEIEIEIFSVAVLHLL